MLELTNSLFYLISKTEGGCSGNRKYMIIETALYQDVLEHSSIFRQLPKDKYPNVLRCLNARVVDYPQDASIAALGDSSGCSGILLTGMLEFARQVMFFNSKIRILSQKKLRDKLKIYLQTLEIAPDGTVCLPYTRRELSEYLYADRSALSRELCKMRDEGILNFSGSRLQILDPDFLAI